MTDQLTKDAITWALKNIRDGIMLGDTETGYIHHLRELQDNHNQYIINEFHKLFYASKVWGGEDTRWLGIPCAKNPLDLMMYQMLLWNIKPDLIIETGTYMGGSALFFATVLDCIGKGQVITIDKKDQSITHHARIKTMVNYDSIEESALTLIGKHIQDNNIKTIFVSLDSDHSYEHVLQELRVYSQFVSVGSYLVVEDTNLRMIGDQVPHDPLQAVEEFLRENDCFEVDKRCEKYLCSFFPGGWLRRVK